MSQWFRKSNVTFLVGAAVIFILLWLLMAIRIIPTDSGAQPIINNYWRGILYWGAAITMVSLGLNLIYGYNGQFSLGQYGFYAIGAYASADVTYRYVRGDSSALIVVVGGSILTLLLMWGVAAILKRFYGVSTIAKFVYNLLATLAGFTLAVVVLVPLLTSPVTGILGALPSGLAQQIVFFFALVGGGVLAGIASFLFGIPVLELGSDYFGIATLGFTIIVKVLLDNTDTILPFPEMKGARGMVGIPQWTTWPWVFIFLFLTILVMRNLLRSSTGRTIVSVREDERAATLVGIDVTSAKILAFVVGSVFAGLAGGIRAHDLAFLHPQTFNFIQSFNPMIIVVFGGLGSMTGTLFAGFAWIVLLEGVLRIFLPPGFETWRFVVYPLVLVLMMLLRPEGLLGQYELKFLRQRLPKPRDVKEAEWEAAEAGQAVEEVAA